MMVKKPCSDTGIVHLWDLPTEKVYIEFKTDIFREAISILHKLYNNSHQKISSILKIHSYIISCIENGKCTKRLSIVISIFNHLYKKGFKKFSLENLEKQIKYIKGSSTAVYIFNPKLPFDFNNSDGGRLISATLHDGSLTDNRYTYANNSLTLKNKVLSAARNIFGDFETYPTKDRLRLPKLIYYTLRALGLSNKAKVFSNPGYPEFIFNCPDAWAACIDQAISDDGYTSEKCFSIALSIDVTKNKVIPLLLEQNILLLQKVGIVANGPYFWKNYIVHNNKEKFVREKWFLTISGKKNLEKLKEIGLSHVRKNLLLHKYLQSYKQNQFPRGMNKYIVLNAFVELKKKRVKVTRKSMSIEVKRHPWRCSEIIRKLIELEWVKQTCEHKNKFTPAQFTITNKGYEELIKLKKTKSYIKYFI